MSITFYEGTAPVPYFMSFFREYKIKRYFIFQNEKDEFIVDKRNKPQEEKNVLLKMIPMYGFSDEARDSIYDMYKYDSILVSHHKLVKYKLFRRFDKHISGICVYKNNLKHTVSIVYLYKLKDFETYFSGVPYKCISYDKIDKFDSYIFDKCKRHYDQVIYMIKERVIHIPNLEEEDETSPSQGNENIFQNKVVRPCFFVFNICFYCKNIIYFYNTCFNY